MSCSRPAARVGRAGAGRPIGQEVLSPPGRQRVKLSSQRGQILFALTIGFIGNPFNPPSGAAERKITDAARSESPITWQIMIFRLVKALSRALQIL